jgi:CAAX protease family protein
MKSTESLAKRILYFPLTKMIIGIISSIVVGFAGMIIIKLFPGIRLLNSALKDMIGNIVFALLAVLIYRLLYKAYEKRKITELSARHLTRNIIAGIMLGLLLQTLIMFIMYLHHNFQIISVNSFWPLFPTLVSMFANAITAEILLIGIIFRITEEKLGSYPALCILALLFEIMHTVVSHGSAGEALAIAMHGGILLGASYIYARNLWFPIAIHFAWDFAQAAIFGASVSGYKMSQTLFVSNIHGPAWIIGGYFGPESSLQAGVFCFMAAAILMLANHKQNKILPPYWKQKAMT